MVIFHSICKRLPEDNDFVAVAVLGKLHRLTTGGTVAYQAIDIGGISPDFPRDNLGWCQFWMLRALNHPQLVEEDMYRKPYLCLGQNHMIHCRFYVKHSIEPTSSLFPPRISGYIMIYHSLSVMFIHFPNNGHQKKKTGHKSLIPRPAPPLGKPSIRTCVGCWPAQRTWCSMRSSIYGSDFAQSLGKKDMGVSENSVPLNPMVLLIIIPIK